MKGGRGINKQMLEFSAHRMKMKNYLLKKYELVIGYIQTREELGPQEGTCAGLNLNAEQQLKVCEQRKANWIQISEQNTHPHFSYQNNVNLKKKDSGDLNYPQGDIPSICS